MSKSGYTLLAFIFLLHLWVLFLPSTASSGTTYTDKQMYIYYLNGTQKLGTFDKVQSEGNQRWLFNYNTTGENYTGMESILPAIYVWENTSLTAAQITAQVSAFINDTNT